jgi:OFA family oxalate/formate antiporter-like MFS transporter
MNNRWISLLAGVLIQIILGGLYAWSTLISQLGTSYGLTNSQGGFIFGLCITIFTLMMILAGRVLVFFGARVTAGIGAMLYAAGYLLASFSNGSYGLLLLGLGIITGAGIGFGYVCPLTVGMKWFPNNKGLVTGISVAGFGSGAIILSATADHFLGRGMDVLVFLRWWGIVTGSILLIAAYVLKAPAVRAASRTNTVGIGEVSSIQFVICAIGIFAGTFAGLLVNGNLIPIVVEFGVGISQSSKAIALFAIGNAVGRIVWGLFFDRLGYKSIPISLIGLSIACTVLLFALPEWMLLLTVLCIGFFFGANFVVYASTIARYFGHTLFSILYPICFVAYGIAGLIAPGIGGYFADLTGSFRIPLGGAIAIVVLAVILVIKKLSIFNECASEVKR